MNDKKVIGILTTFYDFNRAYSLASVVYDQLVMNVRHGYKTVLFVLPSFKDDDKVPQGVEIRKIVPQLILEKYKNFAKDKKITPQHVYKFIEGIQLKLKELENG